MTRGKNSITKGIRKFFRKMTSGQTPCPLVTDEMLRIGEEGREACTFALG
eukprot:m.73332 g.73332  ORF g.73332 m.73332 type:complete len:50 (+) comp16123_c0_seq1:192-341(+)